MTTARDVFNELARHSLTVEQALDITSAMVEDMQAKESSFGAAAAAVPGLMATGSNILKSLTGAGANLVNLSVPAALIAGALPAAGGYALGDMAAGAMDADSGDVAEIQEQELIREIQANAEAVRQRAALHAAQPR